MKETKTLGKREKLLGTPNCVETTAAFPPDTTYVLLHGVFGFVVHQDKLEVGLPNVVDDNGNPMHAYQDWSPATGVQPRTLDKSFDLDYTKIWKPEIAMKPQDVKNVLNGVTVPFGDLPDSDSTLQNPNVAFRFTFPLPSNITPGYVAFSKESFYEDDNHAGHPGRQATLFILTFPLKGQQGIYHVYSQPASVPTGGSVPMNDKILRAEIKMWDRPLAITALNPMQSGDSRKPHFFKWEDQPRIAGLKCADYRSLIELHGVVHVDADTFCGPSGSGCGPDCPDCTC